MDGNVMNRRILFSILLGSLCGVILGAPSSSHLPAPQHRSPSSPTMRSDFTLSRSQKTRPATPVQSSPATRRDRQRTPNSAATSRNNLKNSGSGGKTSALSQMPPRPPRRIHAVIPQPTESLNSAYNYHNNKNSNGFAAPPQQQQQQEPQPQSLEHRQLESQEELPSQRIYQEQSQSQQMSSVEVEDMNGSNNGNNNDGNLDDTAQNINENNIPYGNLNEDVLHLNNLEFQSSSPAVSGFPGDHQLQLQQQMNPAGAILSFQNYPTQQQQQQQHDIRYGVLPTFNFVDQAQHPLPPFPQERINVPQTGTFSIPLSPSPNTFTTIYKPTQHSTSQHNHKMSSKINKNNNNNYPLNPVLPQISVTSHDDSNLDNNNNNSTNPTGSTGNSTMTNSSLPQRRIHIDIVF